MSGWRGSDSPAPEDRDHVEALILVLDELGIDEAALVGNSMGGMTSIGAAVQHPTASHTSSPWAHRRPAHASSAPAAGPKA